MWVTNLKDFDDLGKLFILKSHCNFMNEDLVLDDVRKNLARTELFDHIVLSGSDLSFEDGFIEIQYTVRGKTGNNEKVIGLWNGLEKYLERHHVGKFVLLNDDNLVSINRIPTEGITRSINQHFTIELSQYFRGYTRLFCSKN